ncbi:Gcd10p family-domain-containing protein [Pseudomassariella vexata]|uniref:tRNA (adenine(58)-N(1))-methyltransferase non-catalytic subunit TRM6 n=1 Tax=Pseudomassariella vexata TaxID=1141098 RepID=A0A1Y2D766_9PEZI|nr:Gcd10p family-domain-containing protein [Pseudomassariella vexata]ORY55119.1 Gcd10p family-domain-containing protein [Pseudomassariella vexata]
MHSLIQPNAWVAIKLPSGDLKVLQVTPNTTISLGKYGSFPSNLIIHRPYHLTYELEDRREPEIFNRLRIVPASELYSDIIPAESSTSSDAATPVPEEDAGTVIPTGVEYSLVDPDSGVVLAKTNRAELDASARQKLSMDEIEALKKDATGAGKDLIAKLMLSHTALDQKTEYSLAKYKLLKTKKYIRRFSVLPMDVPLLDHFLLEEKDPLKILDMRDEMIALLGCWANVHYGGRHRCEKEVSHVDDAQIAEDSEPGTGRWLVLDDTGGLLVAAMAERMGILYPSDNGESLQKYLGSQQPATRPKASVTDGGAGKQDASSNPSASAAKRESPGKLESLPDRIATKANADTDMKLASNPSLPEAESASLVKQESTSNAAAFSAKTDTAVCQSSEGKPKRHPDGRHRGDDMKVPYADSNTLTLIHANSQPNLTYLRYYDFDIASPTQTVAHPLATNLMTLSWLQLLDPSADTTYSAEPAVVDAEELKTWKPNRRGNYHRKRRRWARIRHIVDTTKKGGFSGLVVASTMDPVSILRHAIPLLAGGAPIAIYSQSIEPLTALVDSYSIGRRAAWISNPPEEAEGKTPEELEQWAGTEEFPLNPTLLLGAAVQTSRVRKWQVLPGRTHPLMTSKGGSEGYIFTAWRVRPAEGKVEARGKGKQRKRKADEQVS